MNDMVKDYLSHHGILGQKWGVRRFQNYDGTLKSAGKKRYSQSELSGGEVKTPKTGIRKYTNKDGTLTDEGKKRYERDVRENLAKKKDNRIDTSNPDPNRWVKEDRERSKELVDTSADLVKQLSNIEKETRPKTTVTKMDLSQMSDKEMREKINRELLEQQYNKLFSEQPQATVSKGRKFVQNTLAVTGTALGLTSSALSIALSIQKLKSS